MKSWKMLKSDVDAWVQHLQQDWQVVAPVAKENAFIFAPLEEPDQLRLDYTQTILPAGKHFFPDGETLINFDRNRQPVAQLVLQAQPTVLLGVHPCDLHAIQWMDNVMAESPHDLNYEARRQQSVLVGMNCMSPCSEQTLCFDKKTWQVSENEAATGIFDIMLTDIGDAYFVQTATAAGEQLCQQVNLQQPIQTADKQLYRQKRETSRQQFKKHLAKPIAELEQVMRASYDDMLWEVIGEKCLSCGSCNLVCPTCYCFDTRDQVELDLCSGQRCRHWDGCQLAPFSEVAGGENFRHSAGKRLRHRLFRKEVYSQDKYMTSACVGCGRCNHACVAGISLVDIYNQLMEA